MLRAVTVLSLVWLIAACGSPAQDQPETPATPDTTSEPVAQSTAPSFDCNEADSEAQTLVCADAELAGLDRRLADLYQETLAAAGADTVQLTAEERGWVAGRDDCWKATDVRRCVLDAYQTRLVELQIDRPDAVVPATVEYRCDDAGKPVSAVFYNNIDPAAMMLKVGDDQAILFAQPMGSGIRYTRDQASYEEHQGDVNIDFYGTRLACTPA